MAQPAKPKSPSFCLTLFGTDNKFHFQHVSSRWNFIERTLRAFDIEVLGYSSDGDSRCLKAMKIKNQLSDLSPNCSAEWRSFFVAQFGADYPCVQDSIHLANKLKNRLLQSNPLAPNMCIGNMKFIVNFFLKILHKTRGVFNMLKT